CPAHTMQPSDFPTPCLPDVRPVAFSGRPVAPSATGGVGISRFPCKEFPRMRRVFDCAGSVIGLPVAPITVGPSASDNGVGTPDWMISQLDGWPACAPVNASPPALRPSTHDSGSGWLAGLSRVTLAFTTPCRFVPAHCRSDARCAPGLECACRSDRRAQRHGSFDIGTAAADPDRRPYHPAPISQPPLRPATGLSPTRPITPYKTSTFPHESGWL